MPLTRTSGQGRPKGSLNKINGDLRSMILGALAGAGGEAYLQRQADENPVAFMSLLGRVLPSQLTTDDATSVVLLHLAAARAMSAQLIDGQVEPAPQQETNLLDAPVPTE